MEERDLIRQGGVLVGYFEDGTAVLDSAFFGCDAGYRLIRAGRAVLAAGRRKAAGTASTNAAEGAPCTGLAAETRGGFEQKIYRVLGSG